MSYYEQGNSKEVVDNARRLVQTPHKIPQPHDESDVFEKIIEEKIKEKERLSY